MDDSRQGMGLLAQGAASDPEVSKQFTYTFIVQTTLDRRTK